MASNITAAGSASGMDFESIIMASVQAKAAQFNKSTTLKKEENNILISGVGKLKSALETFKKSIEALTKDNGFNIRKVTSDQPTENPYFSISTKSDAANGSYDIAVEQLASTTKLEKKFLGKGDNNDEVTFKGGKLKITLPPVEKKEGDTKDPEPRVIEIDVAEGSTLELIRKQINENDYGVTASIINTKDGKKLVLDSGITGEYTGKESAIKIEVEGEKGEKGDYNLSDLAFDPSTTNGWTHRKGQDAKITIDGEELTSKTNKFDNISGMSITVNRVSEKEKNDSGDGTVTYKTNHVSIEQDNDAVTKKVEEFVNAYNALQQSMSSLGKNNTYTDGKNNYDGGELAGDSMLRSLSQQLQSIMTSFNSDSITDTGLDIYSIGLEVDKDGVFKLDTTKFKENIGANFNAVVSILSKKPEKTEGEEGENNNQNVGLLVKLGNIVEEYVKSNGIISEREDELNSIKKSYEEKEARNAEYLEQYEAGLRQKYAKLDNLIAGYNNSLAYMQSALM